jgi:hypothetical protein
MTHLRVTNRHLTPTVQDHAPVCMRGGGRERSGYHFQYTQAVYRGCINKLLNRQRVSRVHMSELTFRSPIKTAAYANKFIHT